TVERLSCIPGENRRSRVTLICHLSSVICLGASGESRRRHFFPLRRSFYWFFPLRIRRNGAVIPLIRLIRLIRPMPDGEVASSNFSMETGG
ncbi:MAG: hypothetical protein VB141_03845, partial [Burkholderia gladioli]